MQRESDTGYQDDPCSCVRSQGQRIDGDDCPIHGENPDEAEARANMLAFVRTLPGMEECLGGENDWSRWNCTMVYDHKLFEGWGSSFASAYADLVEQIVERYA